MADEDDLELAEKKPKSSKLKWVIIGVLGLALLGGGAAAAVFLTGGLPSATGEKHGAEGTETAGEASEEQEPEKKEAIYVALEPAFTVNFQGNSRARFLQVAVQVMTRDPQVKAQLEKHMPLIRNHLVMLFSSKTASELKTREGKEVLQTETLAGIQKVLKEEADLEGVEAVYFTSFVMQ